jgi:hypothetical protein
MLSRKCFAARWDYIFINYNMHRQNINIQTQCGPYTDKALSTHVSFSPSQSHEIVPLKSSRPIAKYEAKYGDMLENSARTVQDWISSRKYPIWSGRL